MDKLPPIPTPAAQRWREFRFRVLPMVMFAGVALGVASLWKSLVAPTGAIGEARAVKADVIAFQDGTITHSNRIEARLHNLASIPGESVDLPIEPVKR